MDPSGHGVDPVTDAVELLLLGVRAGALNRSLSRRSCAALLHHINAVRSSY